MFVRNGGGDRIKQETPTEKEGGGETKRREKFNEEGSSWQKQGL